MIWRKKALPSLTAATTNYLHNTVWKMQIGRGICPKCVAREDEPTITVPASMVEAAWALQNAVMAINRDPGHGPGEPVLIDAHSRMELDQIRVNLVYALQGLDAHNKYPQFTKEQGQ